MFKLGDMRFNYFSCIGSYVKTFRMLKLINMIAMYQTQYNYFVRRCGIEQCMWMKYPVDVSITPRHNLYLGFVCKNRCKIYVKSMLTITRGIYTSNNEIRLFNITLHVLKYNFCYWPSFKLQMWFPIPLWLSLNNYLTSH